MKQLLSSCAVALAFVCAGAAGQQDAVQRNQSGSINSAPRPAVYTVVAVDPYNRVVRLQTRQGTTIDVLVGEEVYDLATVKPGDRLRVDFLVPNEGDPPRAAATVWPIR